MTPLYRAAIRGVGTDVGCPPTVSDRAAQNISRAAIFDVSGVRDATRSLAVEFHREGGGLGDYGFLPAPVCLLEAESPPVSVPAHMAEAMRNYTGVRSAILLEESDPGRAYVWLLVLRPDGAVVCKGEDALDLISGESEKKLGCIPLALATLAIINAPRGVEREVVPPHKGQARAMRSEGVAASLLRPWTRVKLSAPRARDGVGSPVGGEQKAYHFCRQHTRLRRGRAELVRAHWRGNPALGIVRKTYAVEGSPNA